ncbi:MAG: hypothetical protein IPK55_12045 [Streptococcus sp.]|nr:hypothetical protein [Streptococcus sp.]
MANSQIQAILPNPMDVSITRSSSSLGAASNISIFITTTDPFPVQNGGVIQINIPKAQINIPNI